MSHPHSVLGVSIPASPLDWNRTLQPSSDHKDSASPSVAICPTCCTPSASTSSTPASVSASLISPLNVINVFDRDIVRVAFIGAGGINFGSPEGPWNHSLRLEKKLGQRLIVSHIIDPNQQQVQTVLQNKLNPTINIMLPQSNLAVYHAASYADTKVFYNLDDFLTSVATHRDYPDIVLVGVPAAYHGSTREGANIEMKLASALPHSVLFVDKPISLAEQNQVEAVGRYLKEQNTLCSIGYFMRYLQCVQKLKQLIQEYHINVMSTVARYTSCYAAIKKPDWWIKSISGAPIVEQGTHFVDLSIYFGGRVVISSIQATSVEYDVPCGKLSSIPVNENLIPPHERISRFTTALWKYESGAVGSINFGINLQGTKFECQLEVHGDGHLFIIQDPYENPKLLVRTPSSDQFQTIIFYDDDPYQSQMSTLVDACIKHREHSQKQQNNTNTSKKQEEDEQHHYGLLSTWADASHTYEVTCVIRDKCTATVDDKPSATGEVPAPIQASSSSNSNSGVTSPSPSNTTPRSRFRSP